MQPRGSDLLNVPNFLTGLRFAAIPVFVVLFLQGRLGAALAVFVGAMITDVLDGIAARVLRQFTQLGAMLDPLADKAMGLAALVLLTWSRRLPLWLTELVVLRELAIFTAIGLLDRTGRSYAIRPTRFGKYSTFFLTATIFVALVQGAREARAPSPALMALALVSAECVLVSWVQYFVLWISLMRKPPEQTA